MTLTLLAVLAAALALAWWVAWRAIRFRREAEIREARVLEALFVARHAADGGASIDVDRIFGTAPAPAAPSGADAVLRAMGLRDDVVALLKSPPGGQPAVAGPMTGQVPAAQADRSASPAGEEPADAAVAPVATVPVRDLVQTFYEARGFRAAPAGPSARPVEAVLAHKADAQRAYAFAPLAQPPSQGTLQSIIERARGLGQKRVLIAVEDGVFPDSGVELPAHGVRLLDRAAMEAQLARLDADVADRLRAAAWRRAGRRLRGS